MYISRDGFGFCLNTHESHLNHADLDVAELVTRRTAGKLCISVIEYTFDKIAFLKQRAIIICTHCLSDFPSQCFSFLMVLRNTSALKKGLIVLISPGRILFFKLGRYALHRKNLTCSSRVSTKEKRRECMSGWKESLPMDLYRLDERLKQGWTGFL